MTSIWTLDDMLALGHSHSIAEENGDLEAIMATMSSSPVYEFHPIGVGFSGVGTTRRYYENFCNNLAPKIISSELIKEWADLSSVAQEYNVTVETPSGPRNYNVVGIISEVEHKVGGERIYANDEFIQLLLGDLYTELKN